MKSIKEKANEYAKDYLFSPLPQRAPNIHFEAGANYVLDEIEKSLQEFSNYEDSLIISRIIEQLKSNQ
jgi:hypothetical protein